MFASYDVFEQPLPVCPRDPVSALADMLVDGHWDNFCLCVDLWLDRDDEDALDLFKEILEGNPEDRPLPEPWVDLCDMEASPYACLANCLDAEGYGEETEEDVQWLKSLLVR